VYIWSSQNTIFIFKSFITNFLRSISSHQNQRLKNTMVPTSISYTQPKKANRTQREQTAQKEQ
jgi:hypothetical protein